VFLSGYASGTTGLMQVNFSLLSSSPSCSIIDLIQHRTSRIQNPASRHARPRSGIQGFEVVIPDLIGKPPTLRFPFHSLSSFQHPASRIQRPTDAGCFTSHHPSPCHHVEILIYCFSTYLPAGLPPQHPAKRHQYGHLNRSPCHYCGPDMHSELHCK